MHGSNITYSRKVKVLKRKIKIMIYSRKLKAFKRKEIKKKF